MGYNAPVLVFVGALMHPDFSADYGRVEDLLERTLASVCAQRDGAFRVTVVGNRAPRFALPVETEFVEVDFPAPRRGRGWSPETGFDKGTKVAVGVLAAMRHAPDHVMVFDADDFVSDRLAAFTNSDPDANGWYLTNGYAYSDAQRIIRRIDGFHGVCGTSIIVKPHLYGVPDLGVTASQAELEAGFGSFTIRELLGNHRETVAHLAAAGTPLRPLPFQGAVYTLATGQNWSARAMDNFALPVPRRLAREFGLPVSSTDPRAAAHSAHSFARAVRRRLRQRVERRSSSSHHGEERPSAGQADP
jgi:hypothetical protein